MVFESIVADVLNRFLGDYVENLDASQLKLGIWGGDVVLQNLDLKEEALNELDLPIKTVGGHLGKLTLKIPWKNLYNSPVIASIEDFCLLAIPNTGGKYDGAKEEKVKQDAKQKELQRIEDAKRAEAERGLEKAEVQDTFTEKLVAQIIKNLQITVTNIHIRYEDSFTNPMRPFACGFTLHNLSFQTTNENWLPSVAQDASAMIYKLISLDSLAMYWNSASVLFSKMIVADRKQAFRTGIATKTHLPSKCCYVLGPINASAHLRLNKKPESDGSGYTIPKVLLNVEMQEIAVSLSKFQFQDVMELLQSLERMSLASIYRKYKPSVPLHNNASAWWKFAYTCIAEEDIRRRKRNWSWQHILKHRALLKAYKDAYRQQLMSGKKLPADLKTKIEAFEKQMDVFNIALARKQAEVEYARLGIKEKPDESYTGWIKSWFSAKKEKQEDAGIVKKLEDAMSAEEKAKLCTAIGYQENTAPTVYPKTFVENKVSFILHHLTVTVRDDSEINADVMKVSLCEVSCGVDQRPSAQALKLNVNMKSIVVHGIKDGKSEEVPLIVSSVGHDNPQATLLDILFETNPIDEGCDQRVHVTANPIEIVYHATTINQLTEVFKPPESIALNQLQMAAQSALEDVKEMSTTGLQYAIENHKVMDLNIDFKPSYIIIPENGVYDKNSHVLLVDLGSIQMKSLARNRSAPHLKQLARAGSTEEERLKEMISQSYDKFAVYIQRIQIILAAPNDDLIALRSGGKSKAHILEPTAFSVELQKCMIMDDPRLPKMKINAELPSINIVISEKNLLQVAAIALSIPTPEPSVSDFKDEPQIERISAATDAANVNAKTVKRLAKAQLVVETSVESSSPTTGETHKSTTQFTDLELTFTIGQVGLSIIQQLAHEESEMMSFNIVSLETQLKMRTFDMTAALHIGGLAVQHKQYNSSEDNPLYILETPSAKSSEDKLLSVFYLKANPKSVDFSTVYKSTLQDIRIKVSKLCVALHQEAILSIMAFGNDFGKKIEDVQKRYKPDKPVDLVKSKERSLSTLSTIMFEQGKSKLIQKRKIKEATDAVIDLHFSAAMDSFSIAICDNKHAVTDIDIKGLMVGLKIQKSKLLINAQLKNISVIDPSPNAVYREILSILDNDVLNANVVVYNDATAGRGYLDMDAVDTSVELSVGCVRTVFLNKFVSDLMNFVNAFQAAKERVIEASAAAAEAAKHNMQNVYQKASRIRLNLHIKAPIIIVPQNSTSACALMADLGVLTLKNSFSKGKVDGMERNPPIFDHIDIGLHNFKLSVAKISPEATSVHAECLLLEPCSFNVSIVRNLTIGHYKDSPEMNVICKLGVISLTMTQEDYSTLMSVMNDNLAEGAAPPVNVSPEIRPDERIILPANTNLVEAAIIEEEDEDGLASAFTRMEIACQLESFSIQLYNGSSHLVEGICERRSQQSLAKFELKMFALKGQFSSDGSFWANIVLVNCLWDDTRSIRTGGITRLLEKTSKSGNGSKSMLDVTFRQGSDVDKFLGVKILSFSLVICPDYLMAIGDFFVKGLPAPKAQPTPKTPVAIDHKTKPAAAPQKSTFTIHFTLEQPDIVVVEDVNDFDTPGIIFNNEILVKMKITPDHQVISGNIKNFQLITCCYNPEKRAATMTEILRPCEISLMYNQKSQDGVHADLNISEIALRITPSTVRLLSSIGNAFSSPKIQDESKDSKAVSDHTGTWLVQKLQERNFWFLKTETAEEATEDETLFKEETELDVKKEELVVEMKSIIVTIEAGVGNATIPMILLEAGFHSQVRNWSNLLQIEGSFNMELAYYNVRHASWEPIIEPVEGGKRAWELILYVKKNEEFRTDYIDQEVDDVADGADCIDFLPPAISVNIISEENMEITVTKACLEVLQNLGKIFGEAITRSVTSTKDLYMAPYVLRNETGLPITLILKDQEFEVLDETKSEIQEVVLEVGTNVKLNLKNAATKTLARKSVLREQDSQQQHIMMIKIKDMNTIRPFSVTRADKRFFPLPHRTYPGEQWGMVTDIESKYGSKVITLRSTVQIHNHLSIGTDVFYMTAGGNEVQFCGLAESNSVLNVPLHAVYTPTSELFFRPKFNNYTVSSDSFIWKELLKKPNLGKVLECRPRDANEPTLYISSLGELEQVYFEETRKKTMPSTCFKIHLRPTAILQNLLPLPIVFTLQGNSEAILEEGHSQELLGAKVGVTGITIKIPSYLNNDWICNRVLDASAEELNVWTFEAANSKITMELGMHMEWKMETLKLSLYSPFWMMNKTELDMTYRDTESKRKLSMLSVSEVGDDPLHTVCHPATMKTPVLFSFKGKTFFAKKTASIKVSDAEWSDKFSLDAVGSSGIVTCNTKGGVSYEVGVQIKLTNSGLTKIVVFSPRYLFVNGAGYDIELKEPAESAEWIRVPSGECIPFWPRHNQKGKFVTLRVHGTEEETKPFIYHDVNVTLLRLNNNKGGINVDCQVTEGSVIVTLSEFSEGLVAMRLVNDTSDYTLEYMQSGCCVKSQLQPKETVMYAWDVPSGCRELVWSLGDKKDQKLDPSKDAICEFDVEKCKSAYWVCFLDEMQHVVMFTEDLALATSAQQATEFERVEQELNISLYGVGLSLVDNFKSIEVLYLAIASSGIVWEAAKLKSRRYRPLNIKECAIIETAYQKYTNEMKINKKPKPRQTLEGKIEVDFSTGTMFKPQHRKIRRSFQPGLWFQQKTSAHQVQLHAKINRLQIDDQLHDCVFPTILEPIPPPKSVAADTAPKPFAEASIMMRKNEHSSIKQYKYFKVLIQEFHIKVDQGFINALINMFSPEEVEAKNQVELFQLDMKSANTELKEIAEIQSSQDVKNYYDLLHFSPLKVHISFSLQGGGGGGSDDSKQPTKIHSQFINVLLQSVGVTLTELQGIVFRLAFFERQHVFLSQKQLTSEAVMHYTGQAIKQMYVLVLGLDVIGNPFGLVVGFSKGVEDFFYEPFQGAIQGPEEFAEGLALGVKSLLGHAVGGTAGAVSRITGTLGKGIAALTLDDEYQKKRRQAMNRKPANLQEGLAQSGKGLVMGVFDGVTGVFVKPLEGAKEEGVEGFFKGVGKGVVGLVTRPTSGVVDFASGSLDAVKRATDLSDEVRKIRPARHFQNDGIVRPYNIFEAKGSKLLQDVEKGKFAVTDCYVAHWPLTKDDKSFFLVTDKRLLMISKGEIFGNLNCDWQVTWEEMKELPTVTEKGLKISLKEGKKKVLGLFGSGETSRTVEIKDVKVSTWISSKIEAAFRSNM